MGRKGRQRDAGAFSAGDFWGFAIVAAWIVAAVGLASPSYPAPDPPEQTLAAVRECMTRTPAPWPDAWRQEYIETIRQASAPDPNTSQYARRLQILRDGFPLYWATQKFTPDRPHFEVRQAQIRWYVENLMDANLPDEEAAARLRRQYEELADHGAAGLLTQFSFLDPNMVQKAKADHLADCYRNIDAPLLPIFLMPFSEGQVDQIKERWHDLRYARVDLWQQFGGQTTVSEIRTSGSAQTNRNYLLMNRSLSQWRPHIWATVAHAPDYYHKAVSNELQQQKRRLQTRSKARTREIRLGNAVLQTEYISFLLGALLETAQYELSETETRQDAVTQEK